MRALLEHYPVYKAKELAMAKLHPFKTELTGEGLAGVKPGAQDEDDGPIREVETGICLFSAHGAEALVILFSSTSSLYLPK